jgi:LPXTG-motif cell wall-anchored protein
MKRTTKLLALVFAAMMIFAMMTPAMAITGQYPDGLNFIGGNVPWTVQVGEDDYIPMGDPGGWLNAGIEGGALVLRHAAGAGLAWPRVRTAILPEDDLVLLNVGTQRYLHYDFTFAGTGNWMIMLHLDWVHDLRLANEITINAGMPALAGDVPLLEDGAPGTYRGVIDLQTFATKYRTQLPGFRADGRYDISSMNIFVVGGGANTVMTVRELRISDSADGRPVAPPSGGGSTTRTPKTSDPGTVLIALTGLAGLAGAGVLIRKKK